MSYWIPIILIVVWVAGIVVLAILTEPRTMVTSTTEIKWRQAQLIRLPEDGFSLFWRVRGCNTVDELDFLADTVQLSFVEPIVRNIALDVIELRRQEVLRGR